MRSKWVELFTPRTDTIFHHPAWANLLAECYSYMPFLLASFDGKGEIDAGMPFTEVDSPLTGRRWVSLPFSDFCTPLCRDSTSLDALIDHLICQNRQHLIPRVDIHANISSGSRLFDGASFVLSRIELNSGSDAILEAFDRTRVRQSIGQATRRGVEVHLCNGKSDLYTFYEMLAETHQRLGVPVQPKHFFSLIWDRLIEKGLGFLLLAYKDRLPIAGTVYFHYGSMLTIKYSASKLEFLESKNQTSVIIAMESSGVAIIDIVILIFGERDRYQISELQLVGRQEDRDYHDSVEAKILGLQKSEVDRDRMWWRLANVKQS